MTTRESQASLNDSANPPHGRSVALHARIPRNIVILAAFISIAATYLLTGRDFAAIAIGLIVNLSCLILALCAALYLHRRKQFSNAGSTLMIFMLGTCLLTTSFMAVVYISILTE